MVHLVEIVGLRDQAVVSSEVHPRLFLSDFLRAGIERIDEFIRRRAEHEGSDVDAFIAVFFLIEQILEEAVVILVDRGLHIVEADRIHILGNEGSVGFDIVVYRHLQRRDAFAMEHVFEIEDEILAEAHLGVHAHIVLIHDVAAVELVPDDAVVIVGGRDLHEIRILLLGEHLIGFDAALAGELVADHAVKLADHKIRVFLSGAPHQHLGGILGNPVIRIEELDELSPGKIDSLVPGAAHTGVGFMNHPDTLILLRRLVADDRRSVLRSVIDKQKFKILELLIQNAVDASLQRIRGIINRYNHTYFRHIKTPF